MHSWPWHHQPFAETAGFREAPDMSASTRPREDIYMCSGTSMDENIAELMELRLFEQPK